MTVWSDSQVITNGVTLHYYRTGGDKPPIVLLHGFTDSGLCWRPVAQALESEYDVVMIDARGHGRSSGPDTGFDVEHLAEDALGVIFALKLDRPHLIGHSMGAHTAAMIAKYHPDLVRSLVLEDPPWIGLTLSSIPELSARHLQLQEQIQRSLKAQSPTARIQQAREGNPTWSEDELIAWAASKAQFDLHIFHRGYALAQRKWQVVVQGLTCPTLLITGNPDYGAHVTAEIAQQALQSWSDGTLINIHTAGHSIHRDDYNSYITAVTTFLQAHSTS